ncbi:MAG TPA: hypothetical protein IAB42_03685 [Candidatus Coproplasma avistercoris]|nr:hypothetical protein [Candidatus Coproplasma avistercoris]
MASVIDGEMVETLCEMNDMTVLPLQKTCPDALIFARFVIFHSIIHNLTPFDKCLGKILQMSVFCEYPPYFLQFYTRSSLLRASQKRQHGVKTGQTGRRYGATKALPPAKAGGSAFIYVLYVMNSGKRRGGALPRRPAFCGGFQNGGLLF